MYTHTHTHAHMHTHMHTHTHTHTHRCRHTDWHKHTRTHTHTHTHIFTFHLPDTYLHAHITREHTCVTDLTYLSEIIYWCLWSDSFTYLCALLIKGESMSVTWLTRPCDMTSDYEWHALMSDTQHIHIPARAAFSNASVYVRHNFVTWITDMCYISTSWRDSLKSLVQNAWRESSKWLVQNALDECRVHSIRGLMGRQDGRWNWTSFMTWIFDMISIECIGSV